jgi:transposase-like protein
MPRYGPERKEALLRKLLPPHNLSIAQLAKKKGISDVTFCAWLKQAKAGGAAVPGDQKPSWRLLSKRLHCQRLSSVSTAAARGSAPNK